MGKKEKKTLVRRRGTRMTIYIFEDCIWQSRKNWKKVPQTGSARKENSIIEHTLNQASSTVKLWDLTANLVARLWSKHQGGEIGWEFHKKSEESFTGGKY